MAEHDVEFGLTTLAFPGGHLSVPHQHSSIGESLRVQILARDVSLVTSPPAFQTSVLNVLVATVLEIGPIEFDQPFVDIKLDIGCPLLATITRKSLADPQAPSRPKSSRPDQGRGPHSRFPGIEAVAGNEFRDGLCAI